MKIIFSLKPYEIEDMNYNIREVVEEATKYSFKDVAIMVTAIYKWNDPLPFFAEHEYLIQILSEVCKEESDVAPTILDVAKMIRKTYFNTNAKYNPVRNHEVNANLDLSEFVLQTTQQSSYAVFNPDSSTRLMLYLYDRYLKFDELLEEKLGFTIKELLRFVRYISEHYHLKLSSYFNWFSPYSNKRDESSRGQLSLPPSDFVASLKEGVTFDLDSNNFLSQRNNRPILSFLTGSREKFAINNYSFRRWSFLPINNNKVVLLEPDRLVNTLLTAIHLGLLETLSEAENGEYLRKFGADFENITSDIFNKEPGFLSTARKKYSPRLGDIDVEVEMGNDLIIIQCKSNALIKKNIWLTPQSFRDFLQDSVFKGASQAKETYANHPKKDRIKFTFIVVEAGIFELLALQTHDEELKSILTGLPNPIVISYFDLRYLLRFLGKTGLPDYVEWRTKFLNSVLAFSPGNELSLLRFYFRMKESGELEKALVFHRGNIVAEFGDLPINDLADILILDKKLEIL